MDIHRKVVVAANQRSMRRDTTRFLQLGGSGFFMPEKNGHSLKSG